MKLQPGCDDFDPNSLDVNQALNHIRNEITPIVGFEKVALRAGLDRVLAEDVCSPLDVPPSANSAMDGYALRSADLAESGENSFRVIGTAFAGQPFTGTVRTNEAVRIMTGAVVPAGADTVVMQEHTERKDDHITVGSGHKHGQNVRYPGEDIAKHQVVLTAGKVIRPPELGLLASLGIAEVVVRRRLRVAFFSTGDELISIGETPAPGQIYDSNRYTLYGMLKRLNVEVLDMGVIPDRRDAIATAFATASEIADVLITSGGVSVGDADYVKETLATLGKVSFWKIAMKPGRPLAFGQLDKAQFFGLPGNPVSAMATFYQIVLPSLKHMMGQTETIPLRLSVPCATALKKTPGRMDFQRGILERDATGKLVVRSTGHQGSHILSSMSLANCFIILPAETGNIEAGSLVEVEPFASLV